MRYRKGVNLKRKRLLVGLTTLALSLSAAPAFADPDFGPGNSEKGPKDPGARCHPPGQTKDRPECG